MLEPLKDYVNGDIGSVAWQLEITRRTRDIEKKITNMKILYFDCILECI